MNRILKGKDLAAALSEVFFDMKPRRLGKLLKFAKTCKGGFVYGPGSGVCGSTSPEDVVAGNAAWAKRDIVLTVLRANPDDDLGGIAAAWVGYASWHELVIETTVQPPMGQTYAWESEEEAETAFAEWIIAAGGNPFGRPLDLIPVDEFLRMAETLRAELEGKDGEEEEEEEAEEEGPQLGLGDFVRGKSDPAPNPLIFEITKIESVKSSSPDRRRLVSVRAYGEKEDLVSKFWAADLVKVSKPDWNRRLARVVWGHIKDCYANDGQAGPDHAGAWLCKLQKWEVIRDAGDGDAEDFTRNVRAIIGQRGWDRAPKRIIDYPRWLSDALAPKDGE